MVLATKNWVAKLEIELERCTNKTVLRKRKHLGPLRIQKPFYPEGDDICHLYIIHPPGGVVGGDQLALNISLKKKAFALVTTPGATKFYRSNAELAQAVQTLNLATNTSLEWMPQETIYYSGAKVHLKTQINLSKGAHFAGWEVSCFGQPASNIAFEEGKCHQHFELYVDDQPQFLDRNKIEGGHEILTAQWGLQNYSSYATFLITPATEYMLQKAKKSVAIEDNITQNSNGMISATLIGDVLICRALSHEAEWIKHQFCKIWQTLRPMTINREAHIPRIWST